MTISWFDYSRDVKTVALLAYKRGSGETPRVSNPGRCTSLMARQAKQRGNIPSIHSSHTFEEVTFWRGVSASPDGKFINVTADDGRAFIFNTAPPEPAETNPLWNMNLTHAT